MTRSYELPVKLNFERDKFLRVCVEWIDMPVKDHEMLNHWMAAKRVVVRFNGDQYYRDFTCQKVSRHNCKRSIEREIMAVEALRTISTPHYASRSNNYLRSRLRAMRGLIPQTFLNICFPYPRQAAQGWSTNSPDGCCRSTPLTAERQVIAKIGRPSRPLSRLTAVAEDLPVYRSSGATARYLNQSLNGGDD